MNNKSGSEQVPLSAAGVVLAIYQGHTFTAEELDHAQKVIEKFTESKLSHLQKLCEEQKGEIERLKFGAEVRAELRAISDPYTEFQEGRMSKQAFISAISGPFESQLAEQKAEIERLKKAEKCLDDQLAIQLAEPSIKTDAYMAGLANGMLLAKANFGGDYNPISYKDSRLAEQTERVMVMREALEEAHVRLSMINSIQDRHISATSSEWEMGYQACRVLAVKHAGIALGHVKQALNQERLGDGK